MNPKIFILLATYNRAHLISETLDSIKNQTYTNWECIIVDDYSQDETASVVKQYLEKDIRFSYYYKNAKYKKGLSGSRNYGIDIVFERNGEFIQFFDDDDIMHPQKLELQIDPLIKNNELDLTICCYRKFHSKNTIEFDLKKAYDGSCRIQTTDLLKSFFVNEIDINSPGPLWRSQILHKYRFNEELHYAEERDFYLRIFLNENINFQPIEKVLFWYRKHPEAITTYLYQDRKKTNLSYNLFYQSFLEEILKKKRAPYYIIGFYSITSVKQGNKVNIKKIIQYLVQENRLMNISYLEILIYLFGKKVSV